jgi:hypothetical protein
MMTQASRRDIGSTRSLIPQSGERLRCASRLTSEMPQAEVLTPFQRFKSIVVRKALTPVPSPERIDHEPHQNDLPEPPMSLPLYGNPASPFPVIASGQGIPLSSPKRKLEQEFYEQSSFYGTTLDHLLASPTSPPDLQTRWVAPFPRNLSTTQHIQDVASLALITPLPRRELRDSSSRKKVVWRSCYEWRDGDEQLHADDDELEASQELDTRGARPRYRWSDGTSNNSQEERDVFTSVCSRGGSHY